MHLLCITQKLALRGALCFIQSIWTVATQRRSMNRPPHLPQSATRSCPFITPQSFSPSVDADVASDNLAIIFRVADTGHKSLQGTQY